MSEDQHYLSSFLSVRLPELGLDYETYGPYVTGVVDEFDQENLDEVIELLRASSESHGDDDDEVWSSLQRDIVKLHKQQEEIVHNTQEEALQLKKQQEHERLQKEIELAKKQQEIMENTEKEPTNTKEDDVAKRALVARYAYDESEEYDHDGNVKKQDASGSGPVSNKQAAAQAHQEDARKLRQQNTSSKKVEREKTKEAKQAKKNLKEERRKRAIKGERRR